ncbi:PLP-dependent transferase [Aspergillus aculeatinus CBS 121060]|uniref:PLP-dependent transferase n=1 Tax=Aspergillus aculeatinus CBS 121060 TaxID=1448322 RepID=A0ACD1H3R3_9EURO|nr:PLP-dependent transferase [Aspergillus aculeatinus CBS 121060]RAH68109.1 PLP-dependent transferase [Aspergillus aculeatinus CBS 121060]
MIVKLSTPYSFLDDYSEGAHPRLLEALVRNNMPQQTGYGTDDYSSEARQLLHAQLHTTPDEVAIHFVPSGTSANLISIASCLRPYEAVVAVDSGHISCKEAGAIEATGHKIIGVPHCRGKLLPDRLERELDRNQFFPHMAKPRLVYISQSTELGTVYTRPELQALSAVCRRRGLLMLVDGARLGVALTATTVPDVPTLRDMVDLADIFWVGGTKMGALLGEAVVVRREIAEGFEFHIKQHGALLAKSRVIGVQFAELFRDPDTPLFFELARHANEMARRLADNFVQLGFALAAETETNQVFVHIPDDILPLLEERIRFYEWEKVDGHTVVRIVTSWATDETQVEKLNHRSKVKCVHDGQPPCRRCHRLNRDDTCVLTDPRSPAAIRTPRSRQSITPYPSSTLRRASRATDVAPELSSPVMPSTPATPIATLSTATLINACDIYRKRFPVVNFLHYPSLIADLSNDLASVDPVFLASLLSLCVRFMSDDDLSPEETYATYARTQLAHRAFEAPSLYLAQSLVMLSLYEWGSGHPYRAWMYSGMATYMLQTLLKTADDSMEHNPEDFHAAPQTQIAYEQLVRTYWCCFAQDCELSSGARQHIALSFRQILVPLPISDQDFTFGRVCPTRLMPRDMTQGSSSRVKGLLTIDRGLSIVTRGFDIFVRILRFANENRRGRAGGDSVGMWTTLKGELDEWRELQDVTVRFPETSAQAHVALGYGELFAYINLVYFMSRLFLYRDAFLSTYPPAPTTITKTETETDPDKALDHLFTAAQHIGSIIAALDASGTPVITSYAGYSVFVAAHINMYGSVVPARYPGGRARAEHEKKRNFDYLERLCRYWVVGHSWWRTLQEANRFYSTAKLPGSLSGTNAASAVEPSMQRPDHLTLAGTLDEYGDIRVERPEISAARSRSGEGDARVEVDSGGSGSGSRVARGSGGVAPGGIVSQVPTTTGAGSTGTATADYVEQQLGSEMVQWPFLDENWSLGFDLGFDAAWPGLG